MRPLTVYYDGGCPLCSREIAHYRRLDLDRSIRWVDVCQDDAALSELEISRDEALAVFHVRDPSGRIVKGAEAFIMLWAALPRYRWLAKSCRFFHLLAPLQWAYVRFARWHYRRRCHEGTCE